MEKNIDKKYIHEEIAEFCPCVLEPGHMQEHDGRAWFNDKYK